MKTHAVYNDFEITFKIKYSKFKSKVLFPFVYVLYKLGVSANFISFVGFLAACCFYLSTAYMKNTRYAFIIFIVYLVFDNLDGSLAERTGVKETGQFIDNFYDLASLFCIMLGFYALGYVAYWRSVLFCLLYLVVILGGSVCKLNNCKVIILRLRIFPYALFGLNYLFGKSLLNFNRFMELLIFIQLISVISIVKAFKVHRKSITTPPCLIQSADELKTLGPVTCIMSLSILIHSFFML